MIANYPPATQKNGTAQNRSNASLFPVFTYIALHSFTHYMLLLMLLLLLFWLYFWRLDLKAM